MRAWSSLALLLSSLAGAQATQPATIAPVPKPGDAPPGVDVWLEKSAYRTFDKASVYFAADPGAYVVVVRVTPRGTLEVLYPTSPAIQTPYVANSEGRTELRFRSDGVEGFGEITAVASAVPFDFSRIASGGRWSSQRLSHPRPRSLESVSSAFLDKIAGPAGTRYGIASATYGVGMSTAEFAALSAGIPTAESAARYNAARCRAYAMSNPLSPDPSCVAAYMQASDPKPKLGGPRTRSSGGSETESPPAQKK